jgi:hypothetical protein
LGNSAASKGFAANAEIACSISTAFFDSHQRLFFFSASLFAFSRLPRLLNDLTGLPRR